MCLIALDWKPEDTPAFILAANRDEFYERPSLQAHFWDDEPRIYGGRDVSMGGSWICCSTSGRCAAVTNFFSREDHGKNYPRSRGKIVSNFVTSTLPAEDFVLTELEPYKKEYGGFSVIFFDGRSLVCCSNRDNCQFSRTLTPGTYGLSNNALDSPWQKVRKIKAAVATSRQLGNDHEKIAQGLLDELEDTECVEDRSLLPTTLSAEEEYVRSAIFVRGAHFGTRTSTVITGTAGRGFDFTEKNHPTAVSSSSSLSHEFVAERSMKSRKDE